MPRKSSPADGDARSGVRPHWSQVLRALREARGVTQEGWGALLGFGRTTVQRWEGGEAVPEAEAEARILAVCEENGLFRAFGHGPLRGVSLTAVWLRTLLAEARLGGAQAGPDRGVSAASANVPPAFGSMPLALTSFIGRECEVEEVTRLLGTTRLLTLTGPGGTGKTRLALAVADAARGEFADGVFFVDLSPLSEAGLVASNIAQTLGVRETQEQPLTDALKASLREKRLLLVLDNFEQVLPAALLLPDLLAACPYLRLLVTSRAVLHVRGEREYRVPPLAAPADETGETTPAALLRYPATALFVGRAQEVCGDFTFTMENAPAVAAICRHLDGLPLALELAAARTALLSPTALLERLSSRLQVLTGGPRDAPARQRTLQDTLAWSYDLLTEPERRLFGWLSIFVGGFTLEAAEAVCADERVSTLDVLDGVASLVDHSLLRREEASGGEPRFGMLETVREFGLEQLTAGGEREALRWRHATFFLGLAEQAEPQLRGAAREPWMQRLAGELDNIRAALRWAVETGEAEAGARLVAALQWFWYIRGSLSEGRRWAEELLALPGLAGPSRARAQALSVAGFQAWGQGDFAAARARMEESAAIWRAMGDPAGLGYALIIWAISTQDDYVAARALAEEGVARYQELGDQWGHALALTTLGIVAGNFGDDDAARVPLEESAAIYRSLRDAWALTIPLANLGRLALRQREYDLARSLFEELLLPARRSADKRTIALALNGLGRIAQQQGDVARAQTLFEESLALYRDVGNRPAIANLLTALGLLLVAQDEVATAVPLLLEGLTQHRELGRARGVAACLGGLARAALVRGQPERSARLLGAEEALRERDGGAILPVYQRPYQETVRGVRAALGDEAFAAAWAAGRVLRLDWVIAEALGLSALV